MNLETARIPTFTVARQRLVYTGLSGYRSNNGRVLYQIPLCVAWEFCYNRPPYAFPSFEMGEEAVIITAFYKENTDETLDYYDLTED